MVNYLTERQIFEWRMGRSMTDEEIEALTPKRHQTGAAKRLNDSDAKWVFCEICERPFCVNAGFEDRKPRTPKYKGLVICPDCDPRHHQDRYLKEGYRIAHRHRLRIIQMAQVCQALATRPCRKAEPGSFIPKCRCPECVAGKLFPPF
jgi:hypothetical protein